MVEIREISESEKAYWDSEIRRFDYAHPLNAFDWGKIRQIDNWSPIYLVAERSGRFCGALMILSKKIPFTPFSIFYSPRSPVWDYDDDETIEKLIEAARKIAKNKKALFLRCDPAIPEGVIASNGDKLTRLGFRHLEQRWTFWNTPRDVSRIDLTRAQTAEGFFNLLDRDTRRCIRKAAKEGVAIEPATTESELEIFYGIFKEFTVNKGFMSRGYEYQRRLWETYVTHENGRLFLAKYQGNIIGGLICIMFADKCLAMHMGTPYKYHNLYSYYAYVWESIKWAKERGCRWYSFRGVGTTPTQEHFKNKFLPEPVGMAGYYDLPFRSWLYRIFYVLEFQALPRAWPALIRVRRIYKTALTIFGQQSLTGQRPGLYTRLKQNLQRTAP
ncbi:MAG: peptidoglycan bridge formation glycyltransferase FemA/FemB family protein [Deltaproteobacteria bacterium]|nr:peptidoglycan bridge formation glycyltransferase FemA/FemB family protein [Deltaproteobacteria bacterium]